MNLRFTSILINGRDRTVAQRPGAARHLSVIMKLWTWHAAEPCHKFMIDAGQRGALGVGRCQVVVRWAARARERWRSLPSPRRWRSFFSRPAMGTRFWGARGSL